MIQFVILKVYNTKIIYFIEVNNIYEYYAVAKECKDVYEVMRKDFYVVTPCHSTARPGSIMEGTRLTIQVFNFIYIS